MSNKIETCTVQTINLAHLVSPSREIKRAWQFPNIIEWRRTVTKPPPAEPKNKKLVYFRRFVRATKFGVFCEAVRLAHAQGVWSGGDETEAIYGRIYMGINYAMEHRDQVTVDNLHAKVYSLGVSQLKAMQDSYVTLTDMCKEYIHNTVEKMHAFFEDN